MDIFCSDFPRLFTTYARYRSLSAEVCSSSTFRCFCRARSCNRHGLGVGVAGIGVSDLLGELTRGDRAQADGLAVPLAVDVAVLEMALNYFVSDRHNC